MTDEDYLRAVLNCDDQSGVATDAAWRAVSALRARAERAEAEVQRLHRVIAESRSMMTLINASTNAWSLPRRRPARCGATGRGAAGS